MLSGAARHIIDEALKSNENSHDAALALRTECEAAEDWDLAEAVFDELIERGNLLPGPGRKS